MKIRKRQNKLYELFNGRNSDRYIVVTTAFTHLFFIIFFYNIFYLWSFELCVLDVGFSLTNAEFGLYYNADNHFKEVKNLI